MGGCRMCKVNAKRKGKKLVLGHQVRNLEMSLSGCLMVGSSKDQARKPSKPKTPKKT